MGPWKSLAFIVLTGCLLMGCLATAPTAAQEESVPQSDQFEFAPIRFDRFIGFLDNGQRVLTASSTRAATTVASVWSLTDGTLQASFALATDDMHHADIAVSHDSNRILMAGDSSAQLWKIESAETIQRFDWEPDVYVNQVAFGPGDLCVFSLLQSGSGRIEVWDSKSNELTQRIEETIGQRGRVALSGDGRRLVDFHQTQANVWSVETGERLCEFHSEGDARIATTEFVLEDSCILVRMNTAVGGSPDSTSEFQHTFAKMVISTGQMLAMEPTFTRSFRNGPTANVLSRDLRRIVTVDRSSADLIDASTNEVLRSFDTAQSNITSVNFSSDEDRILIREGGGYVRVWDVSKEEPVFEGYAIDEIATIRNVRFTPNDKLLLVSTSTGFTTIDLLTGERVAVVHSDFELTANPVSRIKYSRDGDYLLATSHKHDCYVWSAETGEMLHAFQPRFPAVFYSEFGGSSSHVIVFSRPYQDSGHGSLQIWDYDSGDLVLEEETGFVALTRDHDQVWTAPRPGGDDQIVRQWNVETSELMREFDVDSTSIQYIALWDDETSLLTSPMSWSEFASTAILDKEESPAVATVWELQSGNPRQPARAECFAWAAETMMSGIQVRSDRSLSGLFGSTELKNTISGEVIRSFDTEPNLTTFRDDGRQFAIAIPSGTVNICNSVDGTTLNSFDADARARSISLSPDGSHVVTGHDGCMTRIWDANTGELLVTLVATQESGQTEWACYSVDGYFTGTPEMVRHIVAFEHDRGVLHDRIWRDRHRPAHVQAVLSGGE